MSDIDKQRIGAVTKLEKMGWAFRNGRWSPPERDDFQSLYAAVLQMQNTIRGMGPSSLVLEITLAETGRHEFDSAIKASPSFKEMAFFPRATAGEPFGALCELLGVRFNYGKVPGGKG